MKIVIANTILNMQIKCQKLGLKNKSWYKLNNSKSKLSKINLKWNGNLKNISTKSRYDAHLNGQHRDFLNG